MITTYASALAICVATPLLGQAAIALCGHREWSWLSPAVGLALLCTICWGTVRLPGGGGTSALTVLILAIASVALLRGRLNRAPAALQVGVPVALLALAAASLPFIAEGRFGILGSGFNPDMSQHLLTADRLTDGAGSQLLHQGYPLGPHAIAVTLHDGIGVGLVPAFSGLTIAIPVLASLTALAAFEGLSPLRRAAGALLVGIPYLIASYLAQGAFKETIQALFVLAFALSLRDLPNWRGAPLRMVPAALIAVGSVYVYSFPGLIWIAATAVIWALTGPAAWRPTLLAVLTFVALIAPELGRLIDFQRFETFDPNGPGLGNLFGQISPFEALGIWPSGDFRLAPGDGAIPAPVYYLGIAFALGLLAYGCVQCVRRREAALASALAAALVVYAAARLGGTPYTAAKAIGMIAPLATVTILLPLLNREGPARGRDVSAIAPLAGFAYMLAAGGCALLALANAPVGPASYSPELTELRPTLASSSTLVLAPRDFLSDEHGTPYLAWELRGGRVCIEVDGGREGAPPPGVRFVLAQGSPSDPPFDGLRFRRAVEPYLLWERVGPVRGSSGCPLIAVRQARQGPSRPG